MVFIYVKLRITSSLGMQLLIGYWMNDYQGNYYNYRDRESMWLETVFPFARRNLSIESYSRHVSHTTKSCILRIIIWNKMLIAIFAEVVEKPFKAPKFILSKLAW